MLRRPVLVETVPDSTHGGLYHTAEIDEVLRRAIGALIAAGEPAERPPRLPCPEAALAPAPAPRHTAH